MRQQKLRTRQSLALDHLLAGSLENLALAFGKTLNPVSRNFVENRVDFTADELFRRHVRFNARRVAHTTFYGGLYQFAFAFSILKRTPTPQRIEPAFPGKRHIV